MFNTSSRNQSKGPCPAVSLVQFSCYYDQSVVLDNINLDIPTNQLTAIMGPGGSGKSTLLNVLAAGNTSEGFTSEGQAKVFLSNPKHFVQKDHGDNFSFYRSSLLDRWENPVIRSRMNDLMGVDPLKERLIAPNMSEDLFPASTKKLIRLLWTLEENSSFLMIDEPFSNLEGDIRKLAYDWILEEKKKKTIILVTHHIQTAKDLADYVVLIVYGTLYEAASNRSFFDSPQHPRTKQYLKFGS